MQTKDLYDVELSVCEAEGKIIRVSCPERYLNTEQEFLGRTDHPLSFDTTPTS
jgi:hypothetical protein